MKPTKDSTPIIRSMVLVNFLGTTEQHMKAHGKVIMLLEKEFSLKRAPSIEGTSKMMSLSEGITLLLIIMRLMKENSKIKSMKGKEDWRNVVCTYTKVALSII